MGTGASKNPSVGVQLNPRVQYAGDLAKQERQDKLIDVPVLVRLEHGTIRYRYQNQQVTQEAPKALHTRIEKPHEGPERGKKHDYFFHATLNDFSEEAAYDKEQEWKFRYVCKGPNNAHQKKLYYVFGRGLGSKDSGLQRGQQPKPAGLGYQWPAIFKHHGHVYFDLFFLKQLSEMESDEEEDLEVPDVTDPAADIEPKVTEIVLSRTDRVEKLRKRMSVRLLKPPGHVHVYFNGSELSAEQVIGDLRSEAEGSWSRFKVKLSPK